MMEFFQTLKDRNINMVLVHFGLHQSLIEASHCLNEC